MDQEQGQKSKFRAAGSPKVAFIFGIIVGLAIFALIGFIALSITLSKERCAQVIRPSDDKMQDSAAPQQNSAAPQSEGMKSKIIGQVGTFSQVDEPICKRDGKPLVLMFSTSWCPHCRWVKPMFEAAVKDYVKRGKIVAHQWELDTNDDTLTTKQETAVNTEDMLLYEKYNPDGSIPTFIFGCQYFRIGTGHERTQDTAAEEQEFKDIIDKLLK